MKENLSQYIGKRIRKYRINMKLAQDELAEKLNTSKGTISNYETGYRSPRQDDLFLLGGKLISILRALTYLALRALWRYS